MNLSLTGLFLPSWLYAARGARQTGIALRGREGRARAFAKWRLDGGWNGKRDCAHQTGEKEAKIAEHFMTLGAAPNAIFGPGLMLSSACYIVYLEFASIGFFAFINHLQLF